MNAVAEIALSAMLKVAHEFLCLRFHVTCAYSRNGVDLACAVVTDSERVLRSALWER